MTESFGKNTDNTLETNVEFESERLLFRPTWYVDSEILANIANDLEIAVAVGENFPYPYGISDADKFKEFTGSAWKTGREYNFGIYDKKSKKYMGNIGFKLSQESDEVENIGYWLGKEFHGKGFATETLKSFLDFILRTFPKVRIIKASALDYNLASQNVLEKCGFVKTGQIDDFKLLRNGKSAASVKFVLKRSN